MLVPLFVLILAFAADGELVPRIRVKRIIGGKVSKIRDFPFQASLVYNPNDYVCSGVIISKRFVITAAHCVSEDLIQVRIGSRFNDDGGSLHWILDWAVHEDFAFNEFNNTINDIALLKLSKSIKFDRRKKPIEMFDFGEEIEPGTRASVSGWGQMHPTDETKFSPLLHSTKMTIVGKKECLELYKNLGSLSKGEICARPPGSVIQNPCDGDSGGPLVIGGRLAGIDSHGEDCDSSVYPEVFTEIAFFRPWIDEQMKLMT